MSKTPKRLSTSSLSNSGISPSFTGSPLSSQKNVCGPPQLAKDIITDVYNNIQLWNDDHISGARIVRDIANIKAENPNGYTTELEEKTNNLYDIVQSLNKRLDALQVLHGQMNALSNVEKTLEPVFISLNMRQIDCLINEIFNAYAQEFGVKEFILENIAHMKGMNEVMFLAAAWTYQCYVTSSIRLKLEVLLTEAGHRKIM